MYQKEIINAHPNLEMTQLLVHLAIHDIHDEINLYKNADNNVVYEWRGETMTPLSEAVRTSFSRGSRMDIIDFLLTKKPSALYLDLGLTQAICGKSLEIIKKLIEKGALLTDSHIENVKFYFRNQPNDLEYFQALRPDVFKIVEPLVASQEIKQESNPKQEQLAKQRTQLLNLIETNFLRARSLSSIVGLAEFQLNKIYWRL